MFDNSGWVKMHRKILRSPIFDNPALLKVWIWCLCKAAHEPIKQLVGRQLVELEAGQFVFGRKSAAEQLGITDSSAYRYMQTLEKLGALTLKANNKFSVVTIEKWEFYQSVDSNAEQQMNSKRTTNEQQVNNNGTTNEHKQELKNLRIKELKKESPPISPSQGDGVSNFDLFWKSYPKKKSKGDAEKAWKSISPSEELFQRIMESLDWQKKSHDWVKEKGRFVPYPATWLRAKGWEDENGEGERISEPKRLLGTYY